MDFRVIWTETALGDLRDLVRYIARDERTVARRFGDLIVSKVGALVRFPRIGRRVSEFGIDGSIAVLRVWHGARDVLDTSSLKPST